MEERLQKIIAAAGIASRRKAEELIEKGRVRVNGRIVRALGTSVAGDDCVEVDGRSVSLLPQHRYVVLHKPLKVMTTMRDPEGRRTVADLVPHDLGRIVPVGRLDYHTAGVLLLTHPWQGGGSAVVALTMIGIGLLGSASLYPTVGRPKRLSVRPARVGSSRLAVALAAVLFRLRGTLGANSLHRSARQSVAAPAPIHQEHPRARDALHLHLRPRRLSHLPCGRRGGIA